MACESEHFSNDELRCPHCGECHMDSDFLETLEEIREAIGSPLFVTSGYRCHDYNTMISTTGREGPHVQGKAVDIMIAGEAAYVLVNTALYHGITGVGVAQKGSYGKRFIHLDTVHSELRPRIWSY